MQLTEFYMRNESMLVFQNESQSIFVYPNNFKEKNFTSNLSLFGCCMKQFLY